MPEQVTPNEAYAIDKQELIEVMRDGDVREAMRAAIREDAIDITDLPDATNLSGKSLPVVDNGTLKSIPYATVIQTVNTAASAANAAAEAADDAATAATSAASSATSAASSANTAAGTANTAAAAANNALENITDLIDEVDVVGNLLVEANTACKVTQNTYNSKSSNKATFVKKNTAFDAYYLAETGNKIYGVVVTMGGTDISSTAVKDINPSAAHVNIASVTGDVVIEIKATKAILFEDSAVKTLCVTNWGGNYIEGEITEYEASKVTTLNSVFYNNTTITKFNELRYFTGLTSLYRSGSGDSITGQFYSCSALTELTLPRAPISDFRGAFRYTGLATIDLTPTTADTLRIDSIAQGASSGTTALRKLIIPGRAYTNVLRMLKRARGITTLEIDGVADLGSVSAFTEIFGSAAALTTITGVIIGMKGANINVADSPLTHDSAMVMINGLASSSYKITFKASTYNTLSADDISVATAKGWTVASS